MRLCALGPLSVVALLDRAALVEGFGADGVVTWSDGLMLTACTLLHFLILLLFQIATSLSCCCCCKKKKKVEEEPEPEAPAYTNIELTPFPSEVPEDNKPPSVVDEPVKKSKNNKEKKDKKPAKEVEADMASASGGSAADQGAGSGMQSMQA